MSQKRSYASPAAFRRALTDKLRAKADESRWTLPQLQRQIAYDRLLERLYLVDNAWVIKGATALLARDIGVRASLDVDVYRDAAREVAEAGLRDAAASDIGDWFRFEIGAPPIPSPTVQPASVCRSRPTWARLSGWSSMSTWSGQTCA